MYLSVFLGPMSRGPHEDIPLIELCLQQAEQAAAAGFCMVTFGEQHFNGYEPYCNPLLMASRLAPFLGKTYFATTICPVVFHHPLRLVEDVNVVEALTGGKFILGMSAGRVGFSPDFGNFGLDPAERIDIFNSKVSIMLQAWAHMPGDSPLVIDTAWDRCTLAGRMTPMSVRTPHPLLAVGTNFDGMIEETAHRGWPVFLGPCPLNEAARKMELHRQKMLSAGFDSEHVEKMSSYSLVTRHVIVGQTEDEAWERAERMMGRLPFLKRDLDRRSLREMAAAGSVSDSPRDDPYQSNVDAVRSWLICGTPDSVRSQITAYGEAGVRHLNTRFTVGTFQPEDIHRSFNLFTTEVMPKLETQLFEAPPPRRFEPPPQGIPPFARKA